MKSPCNPPVDSWLALHSDRYFSDGSICGPPNCQLLVWLIGTCHGALGVVQAVQKDYQSIALLCSPIDIRYRSLPIISLLLCSFEHAIELCCSVGDLAVQKSYQSSRVLRRLAFRSTLVRFMALRITSLSLGSFQHATKLHCSGVSRAMQNRAGAPQKHNFVGLAGP